MKLPVSVALVALIIFCLLQILTFYLWAPHQRYGSLHVCNRLQMFNQTEIILREGLQSQFNVMVQYGRIKGISDEKLSLMLRKALHSADHQEDIIQQRLFSEASNTTNMKRTVFVEKTPTVVSKEVREAPISYPWSNVSNPVNPHDFKLVINQPDFCRMEDGSPQEVFLLVLMISSPNGFHQRDMQRNSCLSVTEVSGKKIRSIFLLGDSGNKDTTEMVRQESEKYGDVLMEDFHDSYRNLTLKTLMGMKWASVYCPQAKFVIKCDDDVFMSLNNIMQLLETAPHENYMTGYVYQKTKPLRDKKYKWYIPKEVYPRDIYPPYCCGIGYILSGDLPPKIFTVSLSLPYIFLEDVYVGLCVEKLNVVPSVSKGFFTFRQDYNYCLFKDAYVVHTKATKEIGNFWIKQKVKPENVTC